MHDASAALSPTSGYDEFAAEFAIFAAGLRGDALPQAVTEAVRVNLLDTLACATAGSTAPGVAEFVALATEWGGGSTGAGLGVANADPGAPRGLGQWRHGACA